ncbi:MAG: hypothetical protein Q4D82_03455 [Neisseria sp.]|nr:hypothetical protein [Neisseria sp.]
MIFPRPKHTGAVIFALILLMQIGFPSIGKIADMATGGGWFGAAMWLMVGLTVLMTVFWLKRLLSLCFAQEQFRLHQGVLFYSRSLFGRGEVFRFALAEMQGVERTHYSPKEWDFGLGTDNNLYHYRRLPSYGALTFRYRNETVYLGAMLDGQEAQELIRLLWEEDKRAD